MKTFKLFTFSMNFTHLIDEFYLNCFIINQDLYLNDPEN